MNNKIFLKKTCSIYANDLHFATVIFPFVAKEIENNITIKTILEKNEEKNIEKIIKNVGINLELKNKINNIDWNKSDIQKIKNIFEYLENNNNKNVDIIILGKNVFIEKANKAIDLWLKNNIEKIEKNNITINVINCFSYNELEDINYIFNSHEFILKTSGIHEILNEKSLPFTG